MTIKPNTFPKAKPSILASLPTYLKDPKNYKKIQRALLETIRGCKKDHSDPFEMSRCNKCTSNMLERHALMGKFGFQSMAQYMSWKKIMDIMVSGKRDKLRKYNT